VEWLFRPEINVPSPAPVEIRTEGSRTRFERFQPSDGLHVYLTFAEIEKPVEIDAQRGTPQPRLYSFIGLDGEMAIEFTDGYSVTVSPKTAPIYVPADGRGVLRMAPQSKLRHAGLSIVLDRVRQMLDGGSSQALADFLAGNGRTRAVEVATTRRLRELAGSLFTARLHGPLQLVFVEGVALQLFAVHAAAAGLIAEGAPEPMSADERHRIERARERLVADMAHPPSIAALAAEAGLTTRALNAGFRAVYGGTVYEVLRDERLEHARIAIELGGLTLKEIAARVGYSHVTNFTSAFTRRYGSPPRRFRRSQGAGPGLTASE
jgi:AraC-like DNA-binding protein